MSSNNHHNSKLTVAILSLGALGVVYGDIGTSPLYAVREIFFSHAHIPISQSTVLGATSLVFWALTIIVSIKYIVFVLRADNEGEGGVFALYSLLKHFENRSSLFISALLVFAAGLLFGDGIITPAISVISAVEGLSLVTPQFEPLVVPITIGILTLLFLIQSKGTAKIGSLFGPIVLIWFFSLALLGINQVVRDPFILYALNPWHIVTFIQQQHLGQILAVLGSVMLVVTGGEAMYADMGHFGRTPIRLSWFAVAYPALILNYLGQGAYLLSGQPVTQNNLFFSMVPHPLLIPMVILATAATIIASQALITGAFSLTTQAINLHLLPFQKVIHTNRNHEGQIYVPFINWALYFGCVLLVLSFRSSTNLAAAYGLAVSGVMLVTGIAMIEVSIKRWQWSRFAALALFVPLIAIDASFLIANSTKFLAGGFVPVVIAMFLYLIMRTWRWGQQWSLKTLDQYSDMTIQELVDIKRAQPATNNKSMVFVTYYTDKVDLNDTVPVVEQAFWDRTGVLPKHLLFLSIHESKRPHTRKQRYVIHRFLEDPVAGSITSVVVNHGFMEDVHISRIITELAKKHLTHIGTHSSEWLIQVPQLRLLKHLNLKLTDAFRFALYSYLANNATTIDEYWGLKQQANLTIQIIPVNLT